MLGRDQNQIGYKKLLLLSEKRKVKEEKGAGETESILRLAEMVEEKARIRISAQSNFTWEKLNAHRRLRG
ncbi:hypothetical protein Xant_20485 [Xanthomonas cissicola]|uniref:Transposase n=1 Tax=Xanthomonas cissicola TaxID=86186 RepID=A0ABX3M512_9XANT|nr:hypothetical protein Xant_20485 [Xanthomonas cissicola]